MKMKAMLVSAWYLVAAGACYADCDVFPPTYLPDASKEEIAAAVEAKQQWVDAGCDKTAVARQEYFQANYRSCVDALSVPPAAEDPDASDVVSAATITYQAEVRACESSALATAAAATHF